LINLFIVSYVSALLTSLFLIKTEGRHSKLSHDHYLDGPQKYHKYPVPRIGGLVIVVGLISGGYYFASQSQETMLFMYWAGVAAIPVFIGGLLEDVTKKISARNRLFLAFLSASIAFYELDPGVKSIDWSWFDTTVLSAPGISLLLTLLMVGGI